MPGLTEFAAIDFETTGSVAGYPVEPWQIGVVRFSVEGPIQWESLLRVGPRPFHPRAPGRHELVREELRNSPSLVELVPELRRMCGGVPLVAHNAATEKKMLRQEVPMEALGPWIDTLSLCRAVWPDLPSHSLGDLLEQFGLREEAEEMVPGREEHDALFDAAGCGLLLRHILRQPGWETVSAGVLTRPDQRAFHMRRTR